MNPTLRELQDIKRLAESKQESAQKAKVEKEILLIYESLIKWPLIGSTSYYKKTAEYFRDLGFIVEHKKGEPDCEYWVIRIPDGEE